MVLLHVFIPTPGVGALVHHIGFHSIPASGSKRRCCLLPFCGSQHLAIGTIGTGNIQKNMQVTDSNSNYHNLVFFFRKKIE